MNPQHVLWITLALAISLFAAIYYAQTVNANNGSNQVIEAGKPVNVSSEVLEDATSWLELIDSGEYEQSWKESGAIFRSGISIAKWTDDAASQGAIGGSQVEGNRVSTSANFTAWIA